MPPLTWPARAEAAQRALDVAFGPRGLRRRWRTTSAFHLRQAFTFDYWWLAHLIEVKVDAFERSGHPHHLAEARRVLEHLRRRTRGSLVNDYFDDMSWLVLALLRLQAASGEDRAGADGAGADGAGADAVRLWEHIDRTGWNTRHGASLSWRVQQPGYKNAPSNGAFALASARLFALTGDDRYRRRAAEALDFIATTLLDPATGIVTDGIDRRGDGRRDDDWVFSYNQGLYAGALVAAAGWRPGAVADATRTATAAIARLAPTGVITSESVRAREPGGGDAGLFKGVFVRYLGELLPHLSPASPDHRMLDGFLRTGTDLLWSSMSRSRLLLAGDDWSRPAVGVTFLSTQLSAVIALETRARLD